MSQQSIVVGYASSEAGRHALTVAAELAGDLGVELHVVHVVDLLDYPVDPDLPDWEEQGSARLAAERAEVDAVLADWPGQWDYRLRRGDPAHALAEVAAELGARMIVVGSRHGSGLAVALERLAGTTRSVAHALERADIPVLVVPEHSRPQHHG